MKCQLDTDLFDQLITGKTRRLSWILRKQIKPNEIRNRHFRQNRIRKIDIANEHTNLTNVNMSKPRKEILDLGFNYNICPLEFSQINLTNGLRKIATESFKDINNPDQRISLTNNFGK
ncbi:hypothetical protein GJ496_003407 [Pomphorhynchus laevis]|nr:hypothetical protein GJ496_003407 [Pomphorhynchus laevis]